MPRHLKVASVCDARSAIPNELPSQEPNKPRRLAGLVMSPISREIYAWSMSALGQKQTSRFEIAMSALPPKDGVIGRRLVDS